MQEIIACDSYGNSLTNLVQWDSDVYVYLSAEEIDSAYRTHFFNNTMDIAMVVETEYSNGILKAKIPNALLMQPHIIVGYVEVIKNGETKSLYGFKINVRKRPQPSNYIYPDTKDWLEVERLVNECREYAEAASKSAGNAKQSENNAAASAAKSADSASNASDSEKAASESETNAKISENNADTSAKHSADSAANAKQSEENASKSAINADISASESANSATNAKNSEESAANSAFKSDQSANVAIQSEKNAKTYATNAESSANKSKDYALLAQSYAVGESGKRENETTDNAKYYCEKSKINADITTDVVQEVKQSKELAEESANNAAGFASEASDYLARTEQSANEALASATKAERIAEGIQNISRWTNTIIDDVTKLSYHIGIENGVVYFSDEFE